MKIVSSGRVLNSREFYEKKKRKRRIKLVLLSVGFLVFFSLLIYLSRQEQFLIAEVTVLGEEVTNEEEIVSRVERLLAGYYLWVFPRASVLTYPRRVIEQSLYEEFPIFKSVNLGVGELQTLLITVEERTPFALYCANTFSSADASLPAQAGECYFLDEEGFIFAPAPSFSGAVYFIYATRDPVENPLGKRFMTIEEFKPLPKFIETLTILNIHPLALEVRDDEYSLFLPNGGQIIWRKNNDLALLHSNLEAFLANDSIRTQENFFDRILYLDLRTENKVFYKFKN